MVVNLLLSEVTMFKHKAALAVLIVSCVLASTTAAFAADSTTPLEPNLMTYIEEQCEIRDIDPELALAIIRIESTFKPESISADGNCFGLMQIHKVNYKMLNNAIGTTDLMDPYQNVEAGIYMISGYVHKYDDLHAALMAYNIGENGAKKLWNKGYSSSKYSRKVVSYMNEFIESDIFSFNDAPAVPEEQKKPEAENKTAGAVTIANKNTLRFTSSAIFDTCICTAPKNNGGIIRFAA